jgi:hypothetical protein
VHHNKESSVNNDLSFLPYNNTTAIMAPVSSRRHRSRHFTPPPDIAHQEKLKHPKTPSRCGVWYAKLFAQELGITVDAKVIRKVTGVPPRGQTRSLASKQV